jgi:hypothetical protein
MYACTAANVWTIQGVPSPANSSGKLLTNDGNSPAWQGLGGDITGAPGSVKVGGLQGKPVSNVAPADGQLLRYNGTTAMWEAVALNGDVSGSPSSLQVKALLGRSLSMVAPADGQLLKFNSSTSKWEAAAISGDVSGVAGSTTVSALQGRPVSITPPADGQMLSWNNAQTAWTPVTIQVPPNYSASFTSASSVTIPGSQHKFPNSNLVVTCYDNASPANLVEPNKVTIDPATLNVTVSFAAAQTGRCVVNGSGGLGLNSGASMAAQLGDLNVTRTSGSVLTIGANCSAATPCNVRFGSVTASITASATATISAGSGTAFFYVAADGTVDIGGSGLTLNCSAGCQVQSGTAQFPANTIPLFTWSAQNGAWNANGGSDQRALLSSKTLVAGTGVAITESGASSTVAIDTTVVPTYLTNTAALAFPSINSGACSADVTISLPGATPGEAIAPGWPALPAGFNGMMRVSANNTVAVRVCNFSGSAATIGSLMYRATLVRGL